MIQGTLIFIKTKVQRAAITNKIFILKTTFWECVMISSNSGRYREASWRLFRGNQPEITLLLLFPHISYCFSCFSCLSCSSCFSCISCCSYTSHISCSFTFTSTCMPPPFLLFEIGPFFWQDVIETVCFRGEICPCRHCRRQC